MKSPGFNTSPTTIIAVFVILASFTFCAIFFKVPLIISWSSQVAFFTTAIGVSSLYPTSNSSTTLSIIPIPKKIHIVAWCLDKLEMLSLRGLGVLPSGRVIITVCEISGNVNSVSSTLAVPNNELTPGIISYSISYFCNSLICSPIAP